MQDLVVPHTLSRELRLSSPVFSMRISNFQKSQADDSLDGTHACAQSSCRTSLIQQIHETARQSL